VWKVWCTSPTGAERVFRVTDIVKPEQGSKVMVLRIDRTKKKIALSLKAAQPKEEKAAEAAKRKNRGSRRSRPGPEPRSCGAESGIRHGCAHFTYAGGQP